MPDRIVALSLDQFAQLLDTVNLTRKITEVHVHHTWRPRGRDFRGLATIEAMRRFHMEEMGWQDIAQHLTIDPAGGLWTGRNWNLPPASQKGANGTRQAGPFMIEMIGDFDVDREAFGGEQRRAALEVIARLLLRFELDPKAIRFHRDLPGAKKTCPGTAVNYDEFVAAVAEAGAGLAPAPQGARAARFAAIGPEHLLGFAVTREAPSGDAVADQTIPEDLATGRAIDADAAERTAARQLRSRGVRPLTAPRKEERWPQLRGYVVNLALGQLSEQGEFTTTPSDMQLILDNLEDYSSQEREPRLMMHAHGGLVSEHFALEYADKMVPWWLSKGVYPLYFVWESGLFDILRQFVLGRRDVFDYTSDPVWEGVLKSPGSLAWSAMKKSARLSSSTDAGSGYPGGAYLFADQLAERHAGGALGKLRVHAVGHSAGSIFHAHLLPLLARQNVPIDTLHLLAPAIRLDLFKQTLLPLLQDGSIGRLHLFTMEDEAERADDCLTVYRKSLLYLVSRAFEGFRSCPLLGLERHLARDADLATLFDGGGGKPKAEMQLSRRDDDRAPNPVTEALRHGDFDNDPATIISVLRRILGLGEAVAIDREGFPFKLEPRSLADLGIAPTRPPVAAPSAGVAPQPANGQYTGRRRALCIGIDRYAVKPLSGCVADATAWGRTLEQLGFQVSYLRDEQATRSGILSALTDLIGSAAPGDVVAFQYSGHGTQLEDEDADESDRFDEAFVPIDFQSGAFLLDDDLAAVYATLPAGVQLTLFMDCCHSGTNSRFAPQIRARTTAAERVRYLPADPELAAAHRAFRASRGVAHRAANVETSHDGVIHLAACQDNEYAWETGGQGDFTAAAARLLAAAIARGDTNEDFLAAVREEVGRKGRQHPLMMPPAAAMQRRPLLAPLGAVPAGW